MRVSWTAKLTPHPPPQPLLANTFITYKALWFTTTPLDATLTQYPLYPSCSTLPGQHPTQTPFDGFPTVHPHIQSFTQITYQWLLFLKLFINFVSDCQFYVIKIGRWSIPPSHTISLVKHMFKGCNWKCASNWLIMGIVKHSRSDYYWFHYTSIHTNGNWCSIKYGME